MKRPRIKGWWHIGLLLTIVRKMCMNEMIKAAITDDKLFKLFQKNVKINNYDELRLILSHIIEYKAACIDRGYRDGQFKLNLFMRRKLRCNMHKPRLHGVYNQFPYARRPKGIMQDEKQHSMFKELVK